MIDYELVEAGRLIFIIRSNILCNDEIVDIWLDYETKEVVVVASDDGCEYVMSVDEFLRAQLPAH